MTVPNVGVLNRKTVSWKHRFLPEIPATRFSCFSGSLRPKLGLAILSVFLVIGLCLIIIPIMEAHPTKQPSAAAKLSNKEAVEAVAKANSDFTKNLYAQLLSSQSGNMIMSSYSVSSVVSMALVGARGATADQMRKGLSLPADEHLHNGYKEVLPLLKSNENFTLDTANKMFVHEGYKLLDEFLQTTKTHFFASPETTNFGDSEAARSQINSWVEDQTNKRIKDLIPSGVLNALTRLVLVNAVYFKGDWASQFNPKATKKSKFHVTDSKEVEVNMMHMEKEFKVNLIKDLNAMAMELPYKGDRLSMVILLPKEKFGLADMEKKLEGFDLHGLDMGRKHKLQVSLPRFKLETSHDLVDALKNLGLKDMFEDKADFSGISGTRDLQVSSVVQKAFIEVNEEGSEAAAATGMVMMMRSMPMPPQPFICDHPFMFFIKDNLTGMILFAGRVTDPTKN